MLCALLAVLFGLIHIRGIVKEKRILPILKAAGLCALLVAFQYVPFLTYASEGIGAADLAWHLIYNTIEPAQLLTLGRGTIVKPKNLRLLSFSAGLDLWLIIGAGLALVSILRGRRRDENERKALTFIAGGVLFAVASTDFFPWSYVALIDHGLMDYVQFTWRLLMLAVVLLALAAGYGVARFFEEKPEHGVLLTLWLTAKIADSAKQREVRQAMQLVALELRDNLQVIQDYKWMYNDEKRVAYRLKEHDFSLDGLPADTVAYYTRRITGSMGKPYRFLTDALEMFKMTGIASDIADKQIVIDLLRCYNELGAFDNSMNIYYDQRMKAILPEQMGETLWSADTNIDKAFGKMLASKKVRNWLGMIPRAFDSRYFETNEEKLETMIAELEKRYQ